MSDFIVVGGGSAGAVIASRLSEDPAVHVALLEAGTDRIPGESRVPAAFSALFRTDVDWNFATAPEAELGDRSLYWPRGRMLGGSSAINAMIWTPPARADLDEWVRLGAAGWDWDSLAGARARAGRVDGAPSSEGGIPVSRLRCRNPISSALLAAALARGIPPNDGFLAGDMDGAGWFRVTQHRGVRVSSADAYLTRVRRRPNLRIVSNTLVRRIVFEGTRAVGVLVRVPGESRERMINGSVVVAAGAIGSPHLLLRSGVGPASELARHGIPVVVDLPGVGRNLQDHLASGIGQWSRRPVSLSGAKNLGNLIRYLALRGGPLTSSVAEAGAFVRIAAGAVRPDLELLFAPTFFVDHGAGNPEGHGFTVAAILLHPASRGEIVLQSADPEVPPIIRPRYLSAESDRRVLREGLELARSLVAAPELDQFRGAEHLPGVGADLSAFIRDRSETLYHPVGTCALGEGPEAVVNPRLAVRGTSQLWVADASVMPSITSGHTHAPTVILAERAVELLRSQ